MRIEVKLSIVSSIWMVLLELSIVDSKQIFPVVYRSRKSQLKDPLGWPRADEELHLDIICLKPYSPLPFPDNVTLIDLNIYNCSIPKTPLVQLFRKLDINFAKMILLQFNDNYMQTPCPKNFTADLPISILGLKNVSNFHVPSEFFTSLTKLEELIFETMEVPALPPSESWRLNRLVLKHAPVKSWDNCEFLQSLTIEGLTEEEIPKSWPINCSNLTYLRLELMTVGAAQHAINSISETSVINLERLEILNCSLEHLPLSLMQSKKLIHINLSYNKFSGKAISQFPSMKELKVLNLSYNKGVTPEVLLQVLPRTPALRELNLDGTSIYYMSDLIELKQTIANLTSLENLHLDELSPIDDTFMHYHFPKLKRLSMVLRSGSSYNIKRVKPIKLLRLHGFPSTDEKHLEVDLSGNNAKHVSIGAEHINFEDAGRSSFWLTNKGYKLTVYLEFVDCDCNNEELARVLREFPHFLAMPDLRCSHGGLINEEPLENLSCRKATVNGCIRRMHRNNNSIKYTTTVDCSNNTEKFRWPQPQGFRGFNASGNHITSLDKAYLPDTLEWLDLRNNNISRLSGEQSARLFGNKGRRVWLAGNNIACDCDNQPMLEALLVHQSLVVDYDNLTCAESSKRLRAVSVAELCRARLVGGSVAGSLLLVLALGAALLARHYWATLRTVLYAHGCCVSCLREKDLDEDRPFDAFLSFAHGDYNYVTEQLLPKLEGEPNFYRVCVHYRDWAVGEWIPAQIMQSVRLSKRTIIVLSKSFVESSWGVLEFRHANAGATADGRRRLLVLVLDDVLSERHTLSPELQGYLELNTYLDCKDPWFWEKLQYAMPHKDGEQRKVNRTRMNMGPRVCALAQIAYHSEGEVLSMQVEEPTDSNEEVPSSTLNVVINTD